MEHVLIVLFYFIYPCVFNHKKNRGIWWILYSRDRVWVQPLREWQLPFPQWPTQFFLFIDICKWMQMSGSWWILGRLSLLFLWTRGWNKKASAHHCSGGGLNSSSGGELKLYLKWKRNTVFGLPKLSLFCIVQRDVASLPSYNKLNSNSSHMINSYLVADWMLIIMWYYYITFWQEDTLCSKLSVVQSL